MARRLPVIQSDESDDALAASRPPVQWVFIGAGLTVTIWVPLLIVAMPLGAHIASRVIAPIQSTLDMAKLSGQELRAFAAIAAAPALFSYFVAGLVSGALVGRFGGRAGPREAALGGVVGGLIVCLLGLLGGRGPSSVAGITTAFLVLSLFGAAGGALGGLWGRRSRR